jgi:RNA-directed DNA polymerase
MDKAKSYHISKNTVWEAYKHVKANDGAAGVDGITIPEFEKNLKDNLYKIWNRMSSGSYFPPPVKAVEIAKDDGKIRKLGVPTLADRTAQMVAKMYLEPLLEPHFHEDSYGYRPNKSALDAVEVARKRCWKYDWVIDMDIKGFFDNIDHELMMEAVKKHTKEPWILLYVQRWLLAPMQEVDGSITERTKGTPQGGVISPLLANLFLHYVFDVWMRKWYPQNPFERYADDVVVHCKTEKEAVALLDKLKERFQKCKLELHPEKTKIVYCKDSNREGSSQHEKFDFLGYTFRPRSSRNRDGTLFVNFSPAMSNKAKKKIREKVKDWHRKIKPTQALKVIAKIINPVTQGWINYYGRFHESELWSTVRNIDTFLMKWAQGKYEQLKRSWKKKRDWLSRNTERQPNLFAHWKWKQKHDLSRRAV